MIKSRPMTEQECIEARLPPKGIFPFVIQETREKHSEKVGDFFSIRSIIQIGTNRSMTLFDNVFFEDSMKWKWRHLCKTCGELDYYEKGEYQAQDIDHWEGHAEIDHRVNKKTGEIEAYVKDYVSAESQEYSLVEPQAALPFDDDIPPFN